MDSFALYFILKCTGILISRVDLQQIKVQKPEKIAEN